MMHDSFVSLHMQNLHGFVVISLIVYIKGYKDQKRRHFVTLEISLWGNRLHEKEG